MSNKAPHLIHAPRQTGETTVMLALAQQLTNSGRYTAVMVSAEVGAPFSHDPQAAENAILSAWWASARFDLPEDLHPPMFLNEAPLGRRIQAALQAWAQASPRPLVVFIDEFDSVQDEALRALCECCACLLPSVLEDYRCSSPLSSPDTRCCANVY